MPSASGPRSQTGLVPTSYQVQVNRLTSPENWSKLPPRPIPRNYPYRGNNQKTAIRKQSKPLTQISEKKKPAEKGKVRKERQWNDCTYSIGTRAGRDSLDDDKMHGKEKSRKEILGYIRQSAQRRAKIDDLQKRLEDEIAQENQLYGFGDEDSGCDDRDVREAAAAAHEDSDHLSREINRFKESFLKRLMLENEIDENGSDGDRFSDNNSCIHAVDKAISGDEPRKIQNSNRCENILYSLGDASTLHSLDMSTFSIQEGTPLSGRKDGRNFLHISAFSIEEGTPLSEIKDGRETFYKTMEVRTSENISDAESGLSSAGVRSAQYIPSQEIGAATNVINTCSTAESPWENLSRGQQCRIQRLSQEFYASNCKSVGSVKTSSLHSLANIECQNNHAIKENKEKAEKEKHDLCGADKKGPDDPVKVGSPTFMTIEDNDSCACGLAAAITENLFSDEAETVIPMNIQIEEGIMKQDPGASLFSLSVEDDTCAYESSRKIPETLPKPRHPYRLPLARKARHTLKKMSAVRLHSCSSDA